MGAFKFSPGHCGAVPDCQCGACTGTICVQLAGPCLTADRAGYLITVKDHASGLTIGTGTTDAGGLACVGSLTPGSYDVTATKTDCITLEWNNRTVVCATLNLTGNVLCLPYGARKYTVLGCFGSPLPGATITISGVESGTATTDSNGVAYFRYAVVGLHTVVISHSSGRFGTASNSFTVANLCDSSDAGSFTLAPGAAYQCCDIQRRVVPPSPYPIAKALKVTDPGGPIAFTNTNCSGSACATRSMSNVSGSGLGFAVCGGTGYTMAPTDIGGGNTKALYSIALSDTVVSANQSTPIFTSVGSGLHYPPGAPSDCSLVYRAWRIAQADCAPAAQDVTFPSTGFTVNSLFPLNVTITFASGGTFGPQVAPITQFPAYATSIVVSE